MNPTAIPVRSVRPLVARLRGLVDRLVHSTSPTAAVNRQLRGYPRNHDYRIVDSLAVPSRRLKERWDRIASLYPDTLTSLLDVGSCKGYFVLEAARRPAFHAAVGIDVYEPFVSLSREVARLTGQSNASFHVAPLDQFAADPQLSAAAPFQMILLLNVYHYLFAGSALSPLAYRDHRPILALLHQLCSNRVIFSSPLDLSECPDQVRSNCRDLGIAGRYTRLQFLTAAAEFFDVEDHGLWGRRPLLVLHRRSTPRPPKP